MAQTPFPMQPHYTAIAIAYRNKALIADAVLPRVLVDKQEFRYLKHKLSEGFTIPDTKVGRRSKPNEMSFSATEVPEFTEDFGLDDPVPQSDVDNAPDNFDPLAHSTEQLTNLILLDREKRAAGLVFDASKYPANNKRAVTTATEKFGHENSDPIATISDALDAVVMRPNIMVIGQGAWSVLARNPKILKAIHRTSGDAGIARREDVAALFELDEILVGSAFLNTAKKGQATTLAQVWGKHLSLIHRDLLATNKAGTTFGFTGQWGQRIAGASPDRNIGLRGGQMVRVGESVKEVLSAPDLGYLLSNVVD